MTSDRLAADLRTLTAATERQAALAAIAACRLCDAAGWRGLAKCDHPQPPPREDTMADQPRWRVRRDPIDAETIPIAGPWAVTSPRGVEAYRAWSQRTALELALSMAAIDDLLARVARLEQQRPALSLIGGGR